MQAVDTHQVGENAPRGTAIPERTKPPSLSALRSDCSRWADLISGTHIMAAECELCRQ